HWAAVVRLLPFSVTRGRLELVPDALFIAQPIMDKCDIKESCRLSFPNSVSERRSAKTLFRPAQARLFSGRARFFNRQRRREPSAPFLFGQSQYYLRTSLAAVAMSLAFSAADLVSLNAKLR